MATAAESSSSNNHQMLDWAIRYARKGWRVLPLEGKEPHGRLVPHGSKDATCQESKLREWWAHVPDANIGLATGHQFFVLDVDTKNDGERSFEILIAKHGPLPDTLQQITGTGGRHFLFRMPTFPVRNSESKLARGIDIRGVGGYIVVPPSIHPVAKVAYAWQSTDIDRETIADAPPWLEDWLRNQELNRMKGNPATPGAPVEAKIPKGQQHRTLVAIAGSLRRRGLGVEEIFALLQVTNQQRCTEPGPVQNIRRIAESVCRYAPDARADVFRKLAEESDEVREEEASAQKDLEKQLDVWLEANDTVEIMRLAPQIAKLKLHDQVVVKAKIRARFPGKQFPMKDFEQVLETESEEKRPAIAPAAEGAPEIPNLMDFPMTDTGNAERMWGLYGRDVRFSPELRKWFIWDGRRWKLDERQQIKQLATKMARLLYTQAAEEFDKDRRKIAEQWARKSESSAGIEATLRTTEHAQEFPITIRELDSHPLLLNCRNGVLDLKTGKLLPHDPAFLITKLVNYDYSPTATCPKWQAFLYRIMGGNPDAEETPRATRLINFLQRALGYSLTADISEKLVFCCFGEGNNGKTTLLETFKTIIEEYSCQIAIDTLMAKPTGETSATMADLADLRGCRFVTTSEPSEGARLNEGKLKYLSAGMGQVKTCRKWENPVSFWPSHKLFMDANKRPVIRGSDKAVWKRLRPVPFVVTIPDEEIDLHLREKLLTEAPGILAWAVRGCLEWQRSGLGAPVEVEGEKEEWRAENDPLADFIDDCCTLSAGAICKAAELVWAYEAWCLVNGERRALSRSAMIDRLEALGCRQTKRIFDGVQARAWSGVEVRPDVLDSLRRQRPGSIPAQQREFDAMYTT
ncbi:MAG: phage/plasmid primase, P4 family [Bryobacteraceae bacterium]